MDIVGLDRKTERALMREAKATILSDEECAVILSSLESRRRLLPFDCETKYGIFALGFEDKEALEARGAIGYDLNDLLTQGSS